MSFSQDNTLDCRLPADSEEVVLSPDDRFLEDGKTGHRPPSCLPADLLDLFHRGAFSFWQWDADSNHLSVQGALVADSIEDWMSRIHPRDQATFSQFLDEMPSAEPTPRVIDYRIKPDRRSDWIPVRHTAVATGKQSNVYSCLIERIQNATENKTKLNVLENQFKSAELRIHRIIGGVLQAAGESFFENLTNSLMTALGANFVGIWEVDQQLRTFQHMGSCCTDGSHCPELDSLDFQHIDQAIETGQLFQISPAPSVLSFKGEASILADTIAIRMIARKTSRVRGLISVRFAGPLDQSEQALAELLLSLGATLASAEMSRVCEAKGHEETESLLRQSQKMEGVGRLSGGMAHDFNNLLTIIQGNIGILQDQLSPHPLGPEITESIDTIRSAATQAAELTNQLLVFSRDQAQSFQVLDLNEVTIEFARMLRRMVEETVELRVDVSTEKQMVRCDKSMLGQVLMNLVVNARDAMPTGGSITIQTSRETIGQAHPKAKYPGIYTCLRIEDSGIGIPHDQLDRIFKPFFTTKEAGKGTGIGLANVSRIVDQHSGFIDVTSKVGSGSAFTIYLPMAESLEDPITTAKTPAEKRNGISDATILLVEDDNAVRRMVRKLLELQGATVREAVSGKDALEIWPEIGASVTLVMTDIVMPEGVTGWDLAEKLSIENPALPILLSSGYNENPADHSFTEGAPIRFLQKPYEIEDLRATLETLLAGVPE